MINLTREKKIILIAGGILLAAGLLYRLAPDVKALTVSREEIVLTENRIQRYRQMVQRRQVLEDRLMEFNRALARMENNLIRGKTQSLAQVDLQNIINEIANRTGFRIDRMRVLSTRDVDDGHFVVIPVEFTGNATISTLADTLYRLESSERMVWVTGLNARVHTGRTRTEPLAVVVTVAGLMKKTDEYHED